MFEKYRDKRLTTGEVMISDTENRKLYRNVLGKRMAYVDEGEGTPILFLHGNPTSSYIWRNVIPHVSTQARCIAPDLIGMGDSEKLLDADPHRYTFSQHRRFLDGFLDELGIANDLIMVGQDWGGVLAMDWARRHPGATRGIAYMETIVRELRWDEVAVSIRAPLERLRSLEGDALILRDNMLVEKVLPAAMLRSLSDQEMAVYRRPFLTEGDDRLPILTFNRELPIDGRPQAIASIVAQYADWMKESSIPKLFINAEPGAMLIGQMRDFCRTWKNQEEVKVYGGHYLQENSPDAIGEAIACWISRVAIA
ncbi:haloalkane dehalogenase [Caballeronia sp. dw_19]|uniref:haloalkane dehalogenase n=1 Tax=Caballeronia sp. dw_19 TaxID=2719791 RepID=UPI001BD3193D|nr:haloalkane dehalogenase [Caballeronia sp. dw_19]